MTKGQKIWFVILIILVVGLAGVLAYPYAKKYYNEKIKSQNNSSASPTATTTSTAGTTSTVTPVSDPGVTWLSEPEKLDDLGLFKKTTDLEENVASSTYYKVADLESGGTIILAFVETDGMGSPVIARFRKDKDSNYSYLINHSYEKDYANAGKILSDKVNAKPAIDGTTYQSLSAPSFLEIKGITLKTSLSESSRKLFANLKDPKEVAQSEYGKLYQTFNNETSADINGATLNLRLPDSSIVSYTDKFNFVTDNEIALITWNDGTKNSAQYTPEGYAGCALSASDNIIINTNNINQRLIKAGKTNNNDQIYTLNQDDAIIKASYNNYKIGRTQNILSLEEFIAKKPVFVFMDGFGRYVVFTGRDFAGLVECGKPVIYLYPEKTTNISVKVAANITKSDPEYKNGWQVTAKPSGKLTVAGKIYDYLFWEGQGQEYPVIDSGKVVETKSVEQTLKNDLAQLGLNRKESADFMEFWLPKMPTTSYVRLTWLGTAQMNKLAPLFVEPKPDTMIRIFLDFEGLDKLININPQKLSAPERKGFTLIEWGGLLKGEN